MKTVFTISELAREFGLTARAIRFYEQEGMIAPARQGQTRLFSLRDRARLALIVRGKRTGFSLAEIREMLDLYDIGDGQITQMRVSRAKFAEKLVALEQQKIDLDEAIEELKRGVAFLDEQLAKAEEAERRQKDLNVVGYGVMPNG